MEKLTFSTQEVDDSIDKFEKQLVAESTRRPLGLTAFEALATEAPIADFGEADGLTYTSTGGSGGEKGGNGAKSDRD